MALIDLGMALPGMATTSRRARAHRGVNTPPDGGFAGGGKKIGGRRVIFNPVYYLCYP
jgi:hypothetical protein